MSFFKEVRLLVSFFSEVRLLVSFFSEVRLLVSFINEVRLLVSFISEVRLLVSFINEVRLLEFVHGVAVPGGSMSTHSLALVRTSWPPIPQSSRLVDVTQVLEGKVYHMYWTMVEGMYTNHSQFI